MLLQVISTHMSTQFAVAATNQTKQCDLAYFVVTGRELGRLTAHSDELRSFEMRSDEIKRVT